MTAIIIIVTIVVMIIVFIIWRYYSVNAGYTKAMMPLYARVEPVVAAIQEGKDVAVSDIEALAKRSDTRAILYQGLAAVDRLHRFPAQYQSLEQIAESHLVIWLLHPNELNAVPDEIELVKTVERSEGDPPEPLLFFIFKYRTHPPHWAADKGWMAGIAGPYWENELPVAPPSCVFSRFEPFESHTPEEHLQQTLEVVLKVVNR